MLELCGTIEKGIVHSELLGECFAVAAPVEVGEHAAPFTLTVPVTRSEPWITATVGGTKLAHVIAVLDESYVPDVPLPMSCLEL